MNMKKALKILLWVILAIVLLLVAAAFTLVKLVDPNDFKPQIISAVNSATGRQLSLPGTLSWTFYPEVGIHLGEASLSNPPGFNQNTFAQINSGNLAVSFWSLLQGKVEFNTLNLTGLKLYLVQNGNSNNWTFTSSTPTTASSKAQTSNNQSSKAYAVSIQSIEINDGEISYDNYQTKSHYALSAINLNANNVGLNHNFPITLAANYNINQTMTGNFKASSEVNFNQAAEVLSLKDIGVQNSLQYPTATNNLNITSNISSSNITVDLKNETVNAQALSFIINQILKGKLNNLQVSNFSAPKFSGALTTEQFNLNDLLTSLNISPIPVVNKSVISQTSMQTQFNGSTNSLNLSNFTLNMGNSQLLGNLVINSFSPFNLTENAQVNQIDLADFVDIKGARLPMTNITSNGNISMGNAGYPQSLNGKVNLNVQSIILKGYDLKALINSLGKVVKSLINLPQLATASAQLQQQMQQVMNSQSVNPNNGKQTDLGTLNSKININQGVITTPLMTLTGPVVVVNGSGDIDLNAKSINYGLNARIPNTSDKFLEGLTIPYQISGNFGNINQGLNWVVLQAELLKFILTQLQQTVQNTVTGVVQGGIKQIEKGGKGASNLTDQAAQALGSFFGGNGNGQ